MRKGIFRSLLLLASFSTLIITLITTMTSYTLLEKSTIASLENQAKSLATGLATFGWEDYYPLLQQLPNNLRITIVEESGEVLYDSFANPNNLENHGDRPEIIEAKRYGIGFAKRFSTTLTHQTFYSAIQVNDQIILRVATQVQTIYNMIKNMIPYLLIALILVLLISSIIANKLVDTLLYPIEKLTSSLTEPISYDQLTIYDELLPLVRTIHQQQQAIQDQIDTLKNERDTINLISNNMREGLILLDQTAKVLAINQSAASIFEVDAKQFIGKSFIHLTRNPDLNRCVELVASNQHIDIIMELSGKFYHIYGCGVETDGKIIGGMLLLVDVTAEQLAQQLRTEFTANVSHELRTPITSISGYAELLARGMVAEKDIQNFAEKIYHETGRIKELIDDLIILGKLDEGISQLEKESTDLSAIVEQVFNRLQPKAEQAQVQLTKIGDELSILTVPSMIDEVLYNLIDNGIKYNKPQGTVTVSLVEEGETVKISVADTGIGIPKHLQTRIFERFYRVDQSRSKHVPGTGLGLAIVKHIVHTLGGKISVHSQEEQGTEVTVTLNKY